MRIGTESWEMGMGGNGYTKVIPTYVYCVQRDTDQARSRGASRYTQSWSSVNRVYDSKPRHYAEDNRIESNCTYKSGKYETEV